MITVTVISQDSQRVVLEGVAAGYPQVTQRWTIAASALVANPSLLTQARDELIARIQTNLDNWQAVQQALAQM